jgi:hypothetical protein
MDLETAKTYQKLQDLIGPWAASHQALAIGQVGISDSIARPVASPWRQ